MGIIGVSIWVIGVIILLTKSPHCLGFRVSVGRFQSWTSLFAAPFIKCMRVFLFFGNSDLGFESVKGLGLKIAWWLGVNASGVWLHGHMTWVFRV